MSYTSGIRALGRSVLVVAMAGAVGCGTNDLPPWMKDVAGDTVVRDTVAGDTVSRDDGGPGLDAVDRDRGGVDVEGSDGMATDDGADVSIPDVAGSDASGFDAAAGDAVQDGVGPDADVDVADSFFCIPDCSAVECGPDPVCGEYCGPCGFGYTCKEGACRLWLPEDHDVNCRDGMCLVPAGPFWMGCNPSLDQDCEFDETPYHEVTLSTFWIDKYEVTVDEYKKCVDAGACEEPVFCMDDEPAEGDIMCSWGVPGRELYPVHHVTVEHAKDYCAWAGKRLPTEAEWEKAARGTDGRKYPWGIAPATCEYAVMMEVDGSPGCGIGHTLPVGSKPAGASPYGVMDMAGNVWEWVHDWYRDDYYDISPDVDPQGPASGAVRGLRGGGFNYSGLYLRTSGRDRPNWYDSFNVNIGFRCVKDVQQD